MLFLKLQEHTIFAHFKIRNNNEKNHIISFLFYLCPTAMYGYGANRNAY